MVFPPPPRLNRTLGLDIRGTTIRKAKFWAGRFLLIHMHPCSHFIHSKMAVMHKGNGLYKTRNCLSMQKKFYACVNSFSRAQKSFLCACKSLYLYFYFRGSVCSLVCFYHSKNINEKPPEKYKYLQMTVMYTKYKAENCSVWTIYVKYVPKIYLSLEMYGILKWKMCRNPVICTKKHACYIK